MASSYSMSLSMLLSLITCLISFAQSSHNGGVTIDLIHCDLSPLSPFYDPSKTQFEHLRNSIERSFSRKSSLWKIIHQPAIAAPLTPSGGEYLIEYEIGTPPIRQFSIVDTGSDLTWTQCKTCTNCYKQNYTLFDPSASSSYTHVDCQTNRKCLYYGGKSCVNKVCEYEQSYAGGSLARGDLAFDTLTLGSTLSLPHFEFGCGKNNNGTFSSIGAGIFGLGNGMLSIVNKHKDSIRGRFSYCLTHRDSKVSSKISFGKNAVVTGRNVVSTPLVRKHPFTFYYLTLKGLSVGTQRFEYKPVNQVSHKGNIMIDSGVVFTYIPSEMYKRVENALKNVINVKPVKDPKGYYNLCYQTQISSPVPVTAHFEGADVVLPQRSIFFEVRKELFCLTMLPTQDLAIFGNMFLTDYLIGYDLIMNQVSFKKIDCTKFRGKLHFV